MVDRPRWFPKTFREMFRFFLIVGLVGSAVGQVAMWVDSFAYTVHDGTRYRLIVFAALLATYPTIAFIRGPVRRRRRRRAGLCIKCGYDLTGNESGVCPECGRPWDSRGCENDRLT